MAILRRTRPGSQDKNRRSGGFSVTPGSTEKRLGGTPAADAPGPQRIPRRNASNDPLEKSYRQPAAGGAEPSSRANNEEAGSPTGTNASSNVDTDQEERSGLNTATGMDRQAQTQKDRGAESENKPATPEQATDDDDRNYDPVPQNPAPNSIQSILKKRKGWVFGGGAAGIVIAAIFAIIGLLPLKLEHLMKNIMAKSFDRIEYAMERRTEKFFESYVKEYIFPNACVKRGGTNCTYLGNLASGSIAKDLFSAWQAGNFEERLAQNQGIVFGYDKTKPRPYSITIKGTELGFDHDFSFDGIDTSHKEMRGILKTAIKDETKWYQIYKRRHVRTLLMRKYGVKSWRMFEDLRDKIDSKVFNAKQALKLSMIERVVKPIAPRYAAYFKCVVEGCKPGDPTDPAGSQITADQDLDVSDQPYIDDPIDASTGVDPATGADEDEIKGNQADLDNGRARAVDGQAADAITGAADEVAEDITKATAAESERLVGQQIIEEIQKVMANKVVKSVAVGIGILEVISKVDKAMTNHTIEKILDDKNKLQYANFFASYVMLSDQLKAGKLRPDEVSALMSNLDGVEKSRVYGDTFSTQVDPANEQCDGKQLDPSQQICPDKRVGRTLLITQIYHDMPLFKAVHAIAEAYRKSIGGVVGFFNKVFGSLTDIIISPMVNAAISALGLQDKIEAVVNKGMSWAFGPILSGNETGKDLFNAISGGASVTANSFAQFGMAGRALTSAEVAELNTSSRMLAAEMNGSQSYFVRFASLDNENSLASKLLGTLPYTPEGMARSSLATLASPITAFNGWFGRIFGLLTPGTKAATDLAVDAFGIQQFGYTEADLSQDLSLTEEQCAAKDKAWAANRAATKGNPTTTNVCRLDKVVAESLKSAFTGDDDGGVGGTQFSTPNQSAVLPSGNAQQLATQILASSKITFTTTPAKQAVEAAAAGQASKTTCSNAREAGQSETSLDGQLLAALLAVSQKYSVGIGYLTNGCHTDGSKHYLGKAVDINSINGQEANGDKPLDAEFVNALIQYLPQGSGIGQKACLKIDTLGKVIQFDDPCTHIHIQVP